MSLVSTDLPPQAELATSRAATFWSILEADVRTTVRNLIPFWRPRIFTVNIPLAGTSTPAAGWITSVGLSITNCRIVGYRIFSLVSGTITVDIRRSTPLTHPTMASLPGAPGRFPSVSGTYAENLDTSLWTSREIVDGDMLHIYNMGATGIQQATLELRLQDLDGRPTPSSG